MAKPREIPSPVFESTTEESSDYSDCKPEPPKKATPAAAALLRKPPAKVAAPSSDSSSSYDESSDSDSDAVPVKKATPAVALPQKPQAKAAAPAAGSSSSYDESSDSEKPLSKVRAPTAGFLSDSDSESSSDSETPLKKPSSSSAVMPGLASAAKKPALAKTPAPAFPAAELKRPATSALAPGADEKRSKKKVEDSAVKKGVATEEGKKLIERIFTTEDEIVVLEELLKHHPIKKDSSEMDDFYDSIKNRISVLVTKAQVQDKISRLRIKFFNQMEKNANKKEKKKDSNNEEEKNKDKLEIMVYELSEKIWGHGEGPKSAGGKGSKGIALKFEEAMEKDEEMEEEEKKSVSYALDGRPVEEWVFGKGVELLDDEEARSELENEWKELRKEEVRLMVKKFELSRKHAEMIYGAMSSKSD